MRRHWAALAAAIAFLICVPSLALGHAGNSKFDSELDGLSRSIEGLSVQVVGSDDALRLVNRSGEVAIVYGYEGEPYARILPDGRVQTNARSPATYMNEDRFAEAPVPSRADPKARPVWEDVSNTGTFTWHDHRIHWMARTTPPQVDDESERTKVFDYRVPIDVGGEPATLTGTLYWVGSTGNPVDSGENRVGSADKPVGSTDKRVDSTESRGGSADDGGGSSDTAKTPFLILAAALLLLGGVTVLVLRRRCLAKRDGGGEAGEVW